MSEVEILTNADHLAERFEQYDPRDADEVDLLAGGAVKDAGPDQEHHSAS